MAQDITASMDGILIDWLKQVGDAVKAGEVVAEMDADKATVEIEAPADGVLIAQAAQSGDSISEGAVIGQIGAADEAPADAGKANGKAAEAAKPAAPQAEAEPQAEPEAEEEAVEETAPSNGAQQATTTTTEDGRIKASPLARRMAEERGIDLAQVTGSGPGGRIVKADIESFKPGAAPAKAAPPSVPLPMPSRTPPPASDDVVHEEI